MGRKESYSDRLKREGGMVASGKFREGRREATCECCRRNDAPEGERLCVSCARHHAALIQKRNEYAERLQYVREQREAAEAALAGACDVAVWLTGATDLSGVEAWPEMREKLNRALAAKGGGTGQKTSARFVHDGPDATRQMRGSLSGGGTGQEHPQYVCAACGWDYTHQPPEVVRCTNCGATLPGQEQQP